MVTIHIRIEGETEFDGVGLPVTATKTIGTQSKEVDIDKLKEEIKKIQNTPKGEISIVHPKTGKTIRIRDQEQSEIIDHVHSEQDLEIYLDSLEKAKQQRIDDLSKEKK